MVNGRYVQRQAVDQPLAGTHRRLALEIIRQTVEAHQARDRHAVNLGLEIVDKLLCGRTVSAIHHIEKLKQHRERDREHRRQDASGGPGDHGAATIGTAGSGSRRMENGVPSQRSGVVDG
jgi:hypothetical protein